MEDIKIGDFFTYGGEKLKVVEAESPTSCDGCTFLLTSGCPWDYECSATRRKDKTSVIFVRGDQLPVHYKIEVKKTEGGDEITIYADDELIYNAGNQGYDFIQGFIVGIEKSGVPHTIEMINNTKDKPQENL